MTDTFKERVYWVTGASGALGGAVARHLAQAGATVVASGRTIETSPLASVPGIVPIPVDVTKDQSVRAAFDQIHQRFERLDGLVVSTNVAAFANFLELTDEDWERVIQAKLLGSVRPIRAALPLLLKQGKGAIVAISGRGGISPPPNHYPGASVNAALDLLVQALGRQYGPQGIRTNAVAPGPIDSPRFNALERQPPAGGAPKRLTALEGPGKPEDVAEAVAYLLSDAARFVNGTRIYVDGGGPPYAE